MKMFFKDNWLWILLFGFSLLIIGFVLGWYSLKGSLQDMFGTQMMELMCNA